MVKRFSEQKIPGSSTWARTRGTSACFRPLDGIQTGVSSFTRSPEATYTPIEGCCPDHGIDNDEGIGQVADSLMQSSDREGADTSAPLHLEKDIGTQPCQPAACLSKQREHLNWRWWKEITSGFALPWAGMRTCQINFFVRFRSSHASSIASGQTWTGASRWRRRKLFLSSQRQTLRLSMALRLDDCCPACTDAGEGGDADSIPTARPRKKLVDRRPKRLLSNNNSGSSTWARTRDLRITDQRETAGYSISSTARSKSSRGIARPSAFAVLRLMVKSNLWGCCMGRSAGLAPLRILST